MKVYVKCKYNSNSGLMLGHSETFTKAIYGFSELGAEIIPYESLDDIYDVVTKEDIVLDYIQQCDTIFEKFGYKNVHVDDYPDCLKKYLVETFGMILSILSPVILTNGQQVGLLNL